jgi:lycopene beta-cyclase
MTLSNSRFDLAVLGGGLSGGLIALAIARFRPELRVLVVERGERMGGRHVWSTFASDMSAEAQALLDPLVAMRWNGYDVCFPGHARRLTTPYCSVTNESLDAALRAALPGEALRTGAQVTAATATSVTLADGETIDAAAVIDARGAAGLPRMAGGWQVFLGQMLDCPAPHGFDRPVVMDAAVDQPDAYRFVYCLPFSPTRVFVEDTYYADSPQLDHAVLRGRIADYAGARGWHGASVAYEETGVLPVIAEGDFAAFWCETEEGIARAGTRAALVHPLTSYSLPDALRFALYLTRLDNLSGEALREASHDWAATHWRERRFYRMLTKMLFGAARPEDRWRVLERFYRLPEPLIERFYAGDSTKADMLRILAGKPPVSLNAAFASLTGRGRSLADLSGPQS